MAAGVSGKAMLCLAVISIFIGQIYAQGARNYSCGGAEIDLVFILDSSTSLQLENWNKLLNATQNLVHDIDFERGGVRIGVITFSNEAEIQFHLNTYTTKNQIITAISSIKYSYGRTNTADALRLMRTEMFRPINGDRPTVPNVAIVITDGISNINSNDTLPEAESARRQGIQIYAIGVGLEATEELNGIAGRLENRYFINNYDELDEKLERIYKAFCPETTIPITSSTPTTTTTTVPITSSKGPCTRTDIDLVFVLDTSTSVTEHNFKLMIDATKKFIQDADIDSGHTRIAIITYSTRVRVEFDLNTYSSREKLLKAVDRIKFPGGDTNTAGAIKTMRTRIFKPFYGDRDVIPNVAIIVTDGVSNIDHYQTIPEAKLARQSGIEIFTIGVGVAKTEELDGIAGKPENRFDIEKFDQLEYNLESVYKSLCIAGPHTSAPIVPKPDTCTLGNSDLVIILDASTSVTQANYNKMLEFTKKLLKNADIDSGAVRVGILIYSTEVEVQFYLDQYSRKTDVLAAIDKIPYIYGSTNTADALTTMHNVLFTRNRGDRPDVPNTAIIITDGVSNINARRTIPEADVARTKNIHIYAVGIGLTDTRELDGIANAPASENSFNVKDFNELEGLDEKIFSALCPGPITTTPAPKPVCGLSKVDVVIILDASTSVRESNFKKMLQFSKDIVDKADIDSGSVRIGVLIYSSEVQIQFYLNQYKTSQEVKDAIDKIPYIYGSTNSADALKTMHDVLFTTRFGDRDDAENVAFMITDGVSNINARRTIPEAEAAMGKGIKIYAIGIGLTDTRELEGMASLPKDEHLFSVKEFDELSGLVDTIFGGTEACAPNEPPVADAGSDVIIQLPVDYTILDGRRSTDDVSVVAYQWIQTSGPTNVDMQGEETAVLRLNRMPAGEYEFTLTVFDEDGQSDDDKVKVIVRVPDLPPKANAGKDLEIQLPVNEVTLNGRRSKDDVAVVRYEWTIVSGDDGRARLESPDSVTTKLSNLTAGRYTINLKVYDEKGQTDEDRVVVTVKAADNPPIADAGPDIDVQLPIDAVSIFGDQSTDDVGIVRYEWTIVSSAGDPIANVDGADKANAVVSRLNPGKYTMRLTVYDAAGQYSTDEMTINVADRDYPPTANAGNDVTLQAPAGTVTLDGSSSTDDEGVVLYRWAQTAGSRDSVVLEERGSQLRVSGLKPGTNTFELTVYDARGQNDTDTVNVVITDDPPVANAGGDRTIELPTDDVTIRGDRSTDDVRIVSYEWRMVSGDRSVQMDGVDEPNLDVSGLRAGTYRFELTVTDESGHQDKDEMTLYVLQGTTPAPTCGLEKIDMVFVVDASTSVTEANFLKQLEFMKSIIRFADVDSGSVRFGALIYSTEVQIQFHLNAYRTKAEVLAAVDRIPYIYGSTNTADALMTMRNDMFRYVNGDRDDAPNVAMVITDGVSNINSRRTIPEAEQSRDVGIQIYAVGIGLTDTRELEAIASKPASENAFAVKDFDELKGLENKIFTSICIDTTTPTTTSTTSTTPVPPSTTPRCGLTKTDLVFILDASTSVTEANFQKMRDFLKDFLKSADVNSGSVRVGVNIYSTEVQIMFHLNQYTSEADILRAIDSIPYIYGSTNTADALKVMRQDMFVRQRGDRPDADNVAVLITDGISNINSRRTIPEAEAARAAGIFIYVVGIGLSDTREVEAIVTPPVSKNLFSIQSFDELVGLRQRIFSSVCPEEEDKPPTANAGRDVTIQLPSDVVLLSGQNSSDDVGIVRYVWSQISGPRVQVSPADDAYLELRNLKEGTYVIELEVIDGKGQSDTDRVTVTVLPEPDLPPIADAGPDQTIQLPEDNVTLSGTRSTDDKGIVSYDWELTSPRDRTVVLKGQNSPTLNVDNLKEGDYTFTLTVKDRKGQSDTDTATVRVLPAPDLPPVANAGKDYEIQLPTDSVTLDGSRSTDDKAIVSYDWTIVSGDSRGVRLRGENSNTLRLENLKEGEYVVRLVVRDRLGQTSSDEARISVKAAPRREGYDVIFVLDSSVNPNYFRWMTDYAKAMIREMSIDDGEFRVGFLTYSNGAYRQFDLNSHDNKADVMAAVDKVGYRPGSKNTAAAFKYVRKQMFTDSRGDRDYAKNYVVHLTGGDSSTGPFESATEACQMQAEGVGMFAVGFGEVSDRSELDAHSSLPSIDYQAVIAAEAGIGEIPGLMLYQLKRGTPRPSPCPAITTTRRPVGPIKCTATGDVVFILDSSGSVGQDNFYRVLNFTYQTINGLDIDDGKFRVGVTTFSDTSRLDFNLNEFSNKQDMENALTQRVVYMYGNTHTAHALRRARTEMFTMQAGDRPDVPNVVVIITDGQSNVNHELTIPEARALKADGVSIITVAVGFTSETSELVGLTSPPISENLIYVADYESLEKLKDQLIEPLCTDTNMCRSAPCQNGGVCMDGIRSFVCLCQEDYFGETCGKRCGEPADVVIVLDSSNNVGQYNFGRLKEYAEHLVREMNKDSCDINLGFMKYSSAAMVQVNLGMHTDTETNIRALEEISYSRGRANMAAAFRSLREQMFNGRNGDRPSARNIAYFLTDGTNDVHAEMAEPEAELAISSGIRIIPIGINLRERFELDNIANSQGLQVIEINDEPGLIENTDTILRPLYEGNDFCAENPCQNGGQCMNEPFGFTCDCPVGYTGETCQKRCSAKGDVVFAVDTSRYVTRKELRQVRRFLRSVVKRMKFTRDEFSVGLVQFTDYAEVSLDFDEGQSKRAVRSHIAGLRVHGGDPEPSQALAKANFRIFNGRGGSRDKPDYLILVTKSMRKEIDILTEANKLKVQGTRILGVGLGLTQSEKEALESAVSLPYRETAMFVDDAKDLDDIADKIVEYMCDGEDVCAENPCRNGGTCQRLGGEFYCECGVGYAGKYCENRCEARADIVFLLDSSGSVGHADFRRVKEFVHRMVGELQIGQDKTRVGLVTYSSHSRHGFFMSRYYNIFDLQNAIAGISYEYGNTNTADGLRRVRERYFGGLNGDRSEIQNFLVVLTDGVSNVQPDQTLVEAQLLKDRGVHIYAVGIGDFDNTEINGIASAPSSQNAFILSDYSSLSNISSSIIRKTCRDPTVCDENPCRNGGLCVPGINGPFCECRAGFRGESCQDACVTVKDIYFLLDSSESVGVTNFQTALDFISSIVEEFSSKDTYNRFSLITFSTDVQIVFSLGRYDKLPVIKNAIKYTRYRPGKTNMAEAFRVVKEISIRELGDRYDADDIIFVITDGNGNVNENATIEAANELKIAGKRIIPIAVRMDDYSEIEQIASKKRDVFKVSSFNNLPTILEDIARTTCENGNIIVRDD